MLFAPVVEITTMLSETRLLETLDKPRPEEVQCSAAPSAASTVHSSSDQMASLSGSLSTVCIKLTRTSCFGSCPSYSIELRGNGRCTYYGRSYAPVKGRREFNVAPATIEKLLGRFRAVKFRLLPTNYLNHNLDAPTYYLTLEIDGKRKTVVNYPGKYTRRLAAVTDLETAVDDVAAAELGFTPNRR